MAVRGPGNSDPPGDSGHFATTHWTLVLSAGESADTDAQRAALAKFCEVYWDPVYAFIRRQRSTGDEAVDLTQGFFARLLERRYLTAVEEGRGRFRSWLLSAVKHYLADERDKNQSQKRGGGRHLVSLDAADAERRFLLEPAHDLTPERLFNRRWALALLDHVLRDLRAECRSEGREQWFDSLKDCIAGRPDPGRYAQAADALGVGDGAVRMAAHRLRRRYRELLKRRIAETVDTPDQIEAEIAFLFESLR